MKRLILAALGVVLAGTATPLRADDSTDGITPHDVSQGAKDAGNKAKDTANEGAYKLRHEKDKAVEKAEKKDKTEDEGGAGSTGGVEESSATIKSGGQSDNPTVGNSY